MLPASYPLAHVQIVKQSKSLTNQLASTEIKVSESSTEKLANPFPSLLARQLPSDMVIAALKPSTIPNKAQDLSKLMSEFPEIFDGQCRPMVVPPCHFKLDDVAKPVSMKGNRPVSEPLKPLLQAELNSLEQQGIIKKVLHEPTP